MDEPVGDGGGHCGGVEDIPPVCERQIGRQDGRLLVVPLADDLEEEVRSLLTERKVPEFVTDQEVRSLIRVEFLKQ